jgi:predicted ATP-binding protein involved in virulence
MKIKHVRIQDFRGIDDLSLDFGADNINVLIGVNGVGKSSVIDCLRLLLSEYVKKLREVLREGKLQQSFENGNIGSGSVSIGSGSVSIGGTSGGAVIISGDKNQVIQHSQKSRSKVDDIKNGADSSILEILVDHNHKSFKWSKSIELREDKSFGVPDAIGLVNLINEIVPSYSPDFGIPLVLCYPVNRAVLDISLDLSDTLNSTQLKAFDDSLTGTQVGFDEFFRWFRSLEDLENEERRDAPGYRDHRLEAVRKALPKFMPEFTNLRIRRSPLRMTVFKQDKELIINQLSDGEKCLLAMVSDLARRLAIANPGLADPLLGEGIILIDEIELHFHPQWQRGILPTLSSTFPNCQFIVSTHSPQIVSDVQPDAIYLLRQTPTGLTVSHAASSYGRDSNQILEDLMGVPDRPQHIKSQLQQLFRLIDDGNLDAAQELKEQLEMQIGLDEPEFAKADVMIRRKEILGR